MKSPTIPLLETERLILRQTMVSDVDEILSLRTNQVINHYLDRPVPKNRLDAEAFVEKITNGKGVKFLKIFFIN